MLLYLGSSLILMIVGAASVTYLVALSSANAAYDRSLLDPVIDIADNIRIDGQSAHLDLPPKALHALVFDQVDKVVFQLRAPNGAFVDGVQELPPPPAVALGEHRFFDANYGGEKMRVAAMRAADNGYIVQVGETLHKRDRLIRDILVAEVVPTIVIAVVALSLAWIGVRRALVPLERVRSDLSSRSSRDLRPLRSAPMPTELEPVVGAFNHLLERLREASSMQQRFLANAAHQLRTPLAGLQMHLDLLMRDKLSSDVRAELQRMHRATIRASRLANQLLALAKAESAPDQRAPFEVVDLASVAGAAAHDWAVKAAAQKIDLGFSLDNASVLGDPVLLPELLDNLIDNALRYTPAPGTVTVSTGYEGDTPHLSVEDTGPGIPDDEKHKVGERFYRIAGTTGDGSGLGLAIVKEVVERHGGVLEISPRSDTKPFRIRVLFPLSRRRERATA
jgi:two-component system sensor histidine kinase TctE